MSKFGWSYPPGCNSVPGDEDAICEVCGVEAGECICPECPECGVQGDPKCYGSHPIKWNYDGITIRTFKDLAQEVTGDHLSSAYQIGRTLYKYIDCGPWISFIMPWGDMKNEIVYYQSTEAQTQLPNCIGIEMGSIVEGSDIEIGPWELKFPFSAKEFWATLDNIDQDAAFYWERDNKTSKEG